MSSPIPTLLLVATLLPLGSFFLILLLGNRLGKSASTVATGAIAIAGGLSFLSLFVFWLPNLHHDETTAQGEGHAAQHADKEGAHAKPHDGEKDGHKKEDHKKESPEGEHKKDAKGGGGSGSSESGEDSEGESHGHAVHPPKYISDNYYVLGQFGKLQLAISYYIDTLTLVMFCMVTLIATLIHFYASGYMHDEEHDVTDHEVTLSDGSHLQRPGRYHRFFQALSLFCFSMLGLVLAGNIAMVFVFWELVGICSYFLIGFYVERKSASNAANKAFIVNRVGDFGFIIGLMALWAGLGTFAFGEHMELKDGHFAQVEGSHEKGIFPQVRPPENHYEMQTPDGMILASAGKEIHEAIRKKVTIDTSQEEIDKLVQAEIQHLRNDDPANKSKSRPGYWLLIVAGVGVFCGCVGKSAQFPLHVWLPDAMEGPTPVSALVHSATMVAAGVYLVGRFFPVFTPEVLLVIAIVGVITLFMAATIAITATDIKRVLAYSTISQLGYMMMALGVGGWIAGIMHLITHAFFKSLLFMCSGSVIHAVHTNEMPQMGGLWRKMPYTAFTMLVGCLAIAGASVPFIIGLSGYYSKDSILEQSFWFMRNNSNGFAAIFFLTAAGGAAITAFYMFRLWFLTFAGKPRDQHRYDHAHESPKVMYIPLVILSVFAVTVAWTAHELLIGLIAFVVGFVVLSLLRRSGRTSGEERPPITRGMGIAAIVVAMLALVVSSRFIPKEGLPLEHITLKHLLEAGQPAGTSLATTAKLLDMNWPSEHTLHTEVPFTQVVFPVTMLAFATGIIGITLAIMFYWVRKLDADDTRRSFQPVYNFLVNKWWFDELYEMLFVKPVHVIARFVSAIDRNWIDWLLNSTAKVTVAFAKLWDKVADGVLVDGVINVLARWTHSIGLGLRVFQTGHLRQYVMFIVIGSLVLFGIISIF